MKTLAQIFGLFLIVVAGLFVGSRVVGQECQQLYGGGEICPKGQVMIDKKVLKPGTKGDLGIFVDNLGVNDHKFTAGQEVVFRLTVKNTSPVKLFKVDVTDILPSYLEHVSGDLKFEIKDLEANASRDFEVKAKVVEASKLPADRSLTCVVNEATASIPENTDRDSSQICIEKPLVKKLPESGPGAWLAILSASSAFGVAGMTLLRRKD